MYIPKDFAERADIYAHSLHIAWLGPGVLNPAWQKCRDERYAKLVLQICILVANAGFDPKEDCLPGDSIKHYFGL